MLQVILLAIAKCDRLAAVPQLLLSFEVLLQTNSTSRTSVVNKVVLVVRVETPDQSLRWCKENQDLVDRIQEVRPA